VEGGGPREGGVLAPAGGVVVQSFNQGGALRAFDAATGASLTSIATGQRGARGPPMTYRVDGVQYVAVMGGSGEGVFLGFGAVEPRLYAYRLAR
jgi:glucose dehydrogenase